MVGTQRHQHYKQHLYTFGLFQQGIFCQCHRQDLPGGDKSVKMSQMRGTKKKSSLKSYDSKLLFNADGGGRTHTVSLPIDFEFLSSSSIWCHPVISSDIWFPLCKGKIHASTNNNLEYSRFFDAFSPYSVFSVWTAQMEIGGMFRRDARQNAPLLRHKTKGKSSKYDE